MLPALWWTCWLAWGVLTSGAWSAAVGPTPGGTSATHPLGLVRLLPRAPRPARSPFLGYHRYRGTIGSLPVTVELTVGPDPYAVHPAAAARLPADSPLAGARPAAAVTPGLLTNKAAIPTSRLVAGRWKRTADTRHRILQAQTARKPTPFGCTLAVATSCIGSVVVFTQLQVIRLLTRTQQKYLA